jgi:two-component system chemotaxis sensor kinase CheA
MSLRMVAIKGTFQKMIRLVRDLNAGTGKDVDLVISGEDTEMDRTMVEELADPLMHMIRNSVDHGIESPEKRAAAGKSAKGTVRLSAFHQGGSIVVEIADDGAGLNTKRILDKALERGVVAPGATLSDSEIHDLIFAPGFSTAETITGISGRILRMRGSSSSPSSSGITTSVMTRSPSRKQMGQDAAGLAVRKAYKSGENASSRTPLDEFLASFSMPVASGRGMC